jgi:hypothetical protein
MERLPWEDGTFDAVTGFNSLQFTEDPAAALREWALAREAIVTAAEPFRRRDGSYRFENAFRYVIAQRP